nr:MAG TPA: hypothetical protein [Caudoviricetes sp.]
MLRASWLCCENYVALEQDLAEFEREFRVADATIPSM